MSALPSRHRFALSLLVATVGLSYAASASAEATSVLSRMPTSGLDQPGASAALTDGPDAVAVNPAGIGFQRGLALDYLHETGPSHEGGLSTANGDGLYLGTRFFDFLGLGVAMEWIRPKAERDLDRLHYRRTSWSLALGGESLSLGAAAHVFTRGIVDDTTWDLGLMARPNRFFSVGFAIRDVDGPSAGGVPVPRRYVGAVAGRPFGDWLTLAVDAEVLGAENRFVDHGFGSMALGYTAWAWLTDGVRVFSSLTHRVDGDGPIVIQAGLSLDSKGFGLIGTPLVRTKDGSAGFLVGASLSANQPRGLDLAPSQRVAVVDLSEGLAAGSELRLLPGETRDPMIDLVMGLDRLARDDRIGGVVVEIRSLDAGMGKAFEIRQALRNFRRSGKPLAVLLYQADDASYFVATAADRIYVTPDAALFINGFSNEADFFAGTLEMVGVSVDVAKVGAYKNAPDAFTRRAPTDEQKEVMASLLDDVFPHYVQALATSRDLPEAQVLDLLNQGVLTPTQALEGGLVDGVLYPDELAGELARFTGSGDLQRTLLRPEPWTSWGPAPEIAVIPIEGTITGGHSGGAPLVQTTGARSVVESIEAAANDPQILAILLRIDSGGGDAGGSQLIWRAARKARERKPVIASMSDVAASGGYFAALGADVIYAAPSTITGSIGIFWIKPSLEGLLGKLDIGVYRDQRGEQADISNITRSWSEAEQASVQRYVDAFYRQFIEATASERGLSVEKVDAVARGRVWTGAQALDRGLIDQLGGLSDALQAARDAAGIAPHTIVRPRVYRQSPSLLHLSAGGIVGVASNPGSAIPEPLRDAILAKIPAPLLVPNPSGLWAVAPFTWKPR